MLRSKYYESNLTGALHDSLQIVQPAADVEFAVKPGCFETRRQWACKCRLCGKEHLFTTEEFPIMRSHKDPLEFHCSAHCDCHQTTAFDWMVLYTLRRNKIRCEVQRPVGSEREGLKMQFLLYDGNTSRFKCALEFYSTSTWLAYSRESRSEHPSKVSAAIKEKHRWCDQQKFPYIGMVSNTVSSIEQLEQRMRKRRIL